MTSIKQHIEDSIYGYDAREFMPIFYEGHLENKAEFVAYKAEKFASALGHIAQKTAHVTAVVGRVMLEHMGPAA